VNSPTLHKTIVQGRLEFNSQKSYDTVTKLFVQRVENYFKSDVLFKFEELFKEEELCMDIPRFVNPVSEKAFKTTVNLLKFCAQYAIAGSIRAWMIENGEVLQFETIEPAGDKGAIMSFNKGRNLVKQKGRENEAIEALSLAIEKYDRHAQAYERRAKVSYFLKNYHDAARDYKKCIGIDPSIPTAYYGKAKIHIINEEWDLAIKDLDEAIKKSIALQTLHWKARRLKGHCHIQLKEWDKAIFDLKLFTNRAFEEGNPNKAWMRWTCYHYATVLIEKEDYAEALKIIEKALSCPDLSDGIAIPDLLIMRSQTKQKLGKTGHIKDLKEAAELGSKRAKTMLKDHKK
jgi:tetratricopeptide (TPR) repeat protein